MPEGNTRKRTQEHKKGNIGKSIIMMEGGVVKKTSEYGKAEVD